MIKLRELVMIHDFKRQGLSVAAIARKVGLEDVRLHDLRHSFASVGVAVGGSLPVIGRVLGRTQAQTTARYAHVGDKFASERVDATGEADSEGNELAKGVMKKHDCIQPRWEAY